MTRNISLVTFIDDDGDEEAWTVLRDLFDAQGEKFCMSLIVDRLDTAGSVTTEQALTLQNDYGVEMLSHTISNARLPDLTEEEAIEELQGSKQQLEELGFNIESFVFTFNDSDAATEALAANYYRSAFNQSSPNYNASPLELYKLKRRNITTASTLSALQENFDDSNENQGWMVYYTHGFDMDAAVQAKINDLIDYIQAANVPIVTVKEALDQLENDPLNLIEQVGTTQSDNAFNGGDVTLTFDVPPKKDDVVIVFGGHGDAVTTLDGPDGYTEIFKNEGTKPICGAWYKVMGKVPDTSVVCDGGGSVLDGVAYSSIVLRGVETSSVLDVDVVTDTGSSPDLPKSPAITTATDGAWLFSIGFNSSNDTSVTAPHGYSTAFGASANDSNDFSAYGSYLEIARASEERPLAWAAWSSDDWHSISLAIRPAPPATAKRAKGSSSKRSAPRRGPMRLRVLLRDGEQLKVR